MVDQGVIALLRDRVIAHNQQPGAVPVKLNALKQIYQRGWRGPEPQARALAKVDDHLRGLAKADDNQPADPQFESAHPRAGDGTFTDKGAGTAAPPSPPPSPKGPLGLPATREAHQAAMAGNAGYQAMQTAVIPETRLQTAGAALRDVGSLALGVGLAASLARGKPNGLTARLLRAKAGWVGEIGTGLATAVGLKSAVGATRLARRAIGRPAAAADMAATDARVRAMIGRGAAAGKSAGRTVGNLAFKGLSGGMRRYVDAVGATASTPAGARARRAAAVVAAGVPAGLYARSQIQDTPVDPAVIGAGLDSFSYRSIMKLADAPDIGAAQAAMLDALQKSGSDFDELRKAIPAGAYSTIGRRLLTGLGSVAGGLAGAAAGAGGLAAVRSIGGGKAGNPYHDEHGRFTSAARSRTTTRTIIGTGLAGAVAGGLATYLALRSHNTRAGIEEARQAFTHANTLLSRIDSAGGAGRVANLIRNKPAAVAAEVARRVQAHPAIAAAKQAAQQFGASSPLRYKAAVLNDLHDRIASVGAFWDNLQVPKAGGRWESVGDIKAGISRASTRDATAAARIKDFLKTATDAQFGTAIANLRPEQQITAKQLWDGRHAALDSVDTQLAAHHGKIATAEANVTAAAAAHEAADGAHADAVAIHARSPAGTPEAAQTEANVATAATARDTAATAHSRAGAALNRLKNTEPSVTSPATGNKITPPPAAADTSVQDTTDAVTKSVTRTVEAAYDKRIATARDVQRSNLIERKHRVAAAHAIMAERAGATQGIHAPTLALAGAQRRLDAAQTAFDRGAATHAANRKRLADLTEVLKGGAPKGMSQADQASLLAQQATVRTDHAASESNLANLRARLATAADERNRLTGGYEAALASPAPGFKLLPDHVRADLERDLGMARAAMGGVADRFLANPTAKMLVDFAKAVPQHARDARDRAIKDLFYTSAPGQDPQFSWRKAITSGTAIATGAAGVAELGSWGWDRVTGGDRPFPQRAIQFTHEVDPITGAGYAAVTIAHPTDKSDRMVLFGEHGRNWESPEKRLTAGGKLSVVRQAYQQGKLGQTALDGGAPGTSTADHSGDVLDMKPEVKKAINDGLTALRRVQGGSKLLNADTYPGGPRIGYRAADDQSGNDAAGKFIGYMREKYLNKGTPLEGRDYWNALNGLNSQQGQALNPTQSFRMLTNSEGRYKNPIFSVSSGWASDNPNTIADALGKEITRAKGLNPGERDIANLHRAAQKIAIAKGLSAEQTAALHTQIRGLSAGSAAAAGAGASAQQNPIQGATVYAKPPGWSQQDLTSLTQSTAIRTAREIGANFKGGHDAVARMLEHFAITVGHSHGLPLADAVQVAHKAIVEAALYGTPGDRTTFNNEVRSGGWDNNQWFGEVLNQEALAHLASAGSGVNKLADLDDLDRLMKDFSGSFNSAQHPRVQSGPGGGEFSGSGGAGGAGGAGANRVPDYHPLRAAQDVAGNAGMMAAWETAGKFLPSAAHVKAAVAGAAGGAEQAGFARQLAGKALANLAGGTTALATGTVKLAAGVGVGALATGVVQAGIHAAGYKLPGETEKPSVGRDIAGTVGSVAGGIAGATAGIASGPGAFAASVGGSWAGQIAGQHLYDWFAPYGASTTARAATRFSTPKAGARA